MFKVGQKVFVHLQGGPALLGTVGEVTGRFVYVQYVNQEATEQLEKRFTHAGKSIAGDSPATLLEVPVEKPKPTIASTIAYLKEEIAYDAEQLTKDLESLRTTCAQAIARLADGKTPMYILQGFSVSTIDTRIAKMTEKKALLAMLEGNPR